MKEINGYGIGGTVCGEQPPRLSLVRCEE